MTAEIVTAKIETAEKMTAEMLDPIHFPLFGKRLIEASAGTGKTYTIANLYLRLLLPSSLAQDFAKPLTVDQILVVTFTEAATAELKARIRGRIRQARKALLQSHDDKAMIALAKEDTFLSQLLSNMTEQQIASGIEHLLYAEKQMDEAAIFTIHGFCQRMLSQNAFESRMLFQQSIETDDQAPLATAVKDVWRTAIYPMSAPVAALIKPIWSGPEALQNELRLLQNQPDVAILQKESSAKDFSLEQIVKATETRLKEIKTRWLSDASDILAAMNESGLDGRFWAIKKQDAIANALLNWAQSDTFLLPKELEKFDANKQQEKLKKNGIAPEHPFFEQVALLYEEYPSQDKIKPALLHDLWQQVRTRLDNWQQQTQKLTFTDLLTNLDHALTLESKTPLAERIRQLFPIAMIDEFQDTDPVQFRIFNQIYGTANSTNNALGLIMIGDPKQAIYAFRGADIYTYLAAKEQVDAIYALGTNYRSSAAMIKSVNALFSGHNNPFTMAGIPFTPVQDRATEGAFQRHNNQEAALQLLFEEEAFSDDAVLSPAQYQLKMANQTAEHISQLLLDGSRGHATLAETIRSYTGEPQTIKRAVYSGDIAVLVSGYRQAQLMKQALAKRNVASVYLSDRGSVFDSNEAHDLLLILQAILSQGKEIPIRSALASNLLGWSTEELDQLNQDDVLYETWVDRFQYFYEVWDQNGILPMLRLLMVEFDLPQKLLSATNKTQDDFDSITQHIQGERRLTDLLHLGEKLQQKSLEVESKEGLLRYLTLSVQRPNGDSDEQKIRLETDDDLVRIITIHKSKGLEYPIVYLPFACMPFRNKDKHALFHDKAHRLFYDPIPEKEQQELHTAELYASEIRLAYVALTRAREVCYLGCAQVGKQATKTKEAELHLHLSGVGALLSRGKVQALGEFEQTIKQWLQDYPAPLMTSVICAAGQSVTEQGFAESATEFIQDNTLAEKHLAEEHVPNVGVRSFSGHIERDWWVGSYSSLVTGVESAHTVSSQYDIEHAETPGFDEFTNLSATNANSTMSTLALDDHSLGQIDPHDVEELTPFTFPKGAKPGTFLHDLLEGKALQGELKQVSFADLLKAQHQTSMSDYMAQQDYKKWQKTLFAWLQDILDTKLVDGVCLHDLSVSQCQKEMEFFLPVSAGFSAHQLDQIARQYDPLSKQAPHIQEQTLKGMLKGFIDLLFEHEGKYYVVDYKSNHLGMMKEDYSADKMAQAMIEHRYDLQYQIYTLALHRFLSRRLSNYDYETHIGGVCYLFLRGLSSSKSSSFQQIENESATGVFTTHLSKQHVLALDQLLKEGTVDSATVDSHQVVATLSTEPTEPKDLGEQYDLF